MSKVTGKELIDLINAIDKYDDTDDFLVDNTTKSNLKNLLIGGADPNSDNFQDKFRDEYHLYRKAKQILDHLE